MTAPPPVQDMPPSGGFSQAIRYQRYLPKRGPSGLIIFSSFFAIMGWGWYWVAQSNAERRELQREKSWARISLVPLLQAETDRDLVRRLAATREREAAIMEGAPAVTSTASSSSSSGEESSSWSALDLKAKTPGVGKGGLFDPHQAEPVYHTDRYVAPTFVIVPEEQTISAQWWRGSKVFLKNPPYHQREGLEDLQKK